MKFMDEMHEGLLLNMSKKLQKLLKLAENLKNKQTKVAIIGRFTLHGYSHNT